MLINSEQLNGLKVKTQSGAYVGRIKSFDVDIDTQSVRSYHIKPNILEGGVFAPELDVHHKQVIDITEEKMTVVDNVVKYKDHKKADVAVGAKAEV